MQTQIRKWYKLRISTNCQENWYSKSMEISSRIALSIGLTRNSSGRMWSIYNFGRRILELELLDMASNGFKTAGLEHGSMVKMSLVFLRLSTIERQAELNNISVNPQIRPESPVPSFALNTKKWVQMALSEIARLRQNHFWPYQIQSAQHNRAHNGTDAISKWPSWTRP